jgi:hypothetical protein
MGECVLFNVEAQVERFDRLPLPLWCPALALHLTEKASNPQELFPRHDVAL